MNEPKTRRTIGEGTPRKRRAETRPGEIVDAALECFLEMGFEQTKLDEVARRAGVAKGTVYIYFADKEALFRAVVQQVIATNVALLKAATTEFDGSFEEFMALILGDAAQAIGGSKVPAIAKLILREADRIPDLARIWFEEVVSPMLSGVEAAIVKGQHRGEVVEGDARVHMLSLMAPMLVSILATEMLAPLGYEAVDLNRLADQHIRTLRNGLLKS